MSKFFVFSTLAASVRYTNFGQGGADLPIPEGEGVLIEGGTGVANKNLVTPRGVVTQVTAEQLEYLERNTVFALHKKNGFIVVQDANKDPERVIGEGMQSQDASAQTTPEDFGSGNPDDGNDPSASAAGDGKKSKGKK
jgi:hypothetical protein